MKDKIRCLIFDGGKDISKNKLIAIGLGDGLQMSIWDIVNSKFVTLDTLYYKTLIKDIICQLEEVGCFVPSVNLDNEASPNGMICSFIIDSLTYYKPVLKKSSYMNTHT